MARAPKWNQLAVPGVCDSPCVLGPWNYLRFLYPASLRGGFIGVNVDIIVCCLLDFYCPVPAVMEKLGLQFP